MFASINPKPLVFTIGLIGLAAALAYPSLAAYLRADFSLILCLLVLPFLFTRDAVQHFPWRYAAISAASVWLHWTFGQQTFLFLAFVFFAFFTIENQLGQVGFLPVLLVLFISPVATFLFTVLGFEIRLSLSNHAAEILGRFMPHISHQGNQIYLGDEVFRVDPACMGLKMVLSAYVSLIALVAYFQKTQQASLPFWFFMLMMLLATVFIILANLLRMVALVALQSAPNTFGHEIVGLLSFVSYILLPFFFGCRYALRRFARPININKAACSMWKPFPYAAAAILLSLTWAVHLHPKALAEQQADGLNGLHIQGFEKDTVSLNVLRYTNNDFLLYLKPPTQFYSADHSPIICWRGSGYKFTHENRQQLADHNIFVAQLQKEDETLYTAWWYSNGTHQTTSQLDWRWRTLTGQEPFRLINLTANSSQQLVIKAQELLDSGL